MVIVTGATGKTGSVVASRLLEMGEAVRVIGRSAEKLESLRSRGAEIAAGDQGDVTFMRNALDGADALYLLIPPKYDAVDFRRYYNDMGDAAVLAIRAQKVKKVVFLSSLGADRESGTGPVVGLHDVEQKLRRLADVDIVFLRPGYFMENILGNAELIATKGINGGPMRGDVPMTLTATADIGAKAAELLRERSFTSHSVVEITGDRLTNEEITRIIGDSLGIAHLPYIQFSDADALSAFTAMGLSNNVAGSYIELMHGIENGLLGPVVIDSSDLMAPTRFAEFAESVFKPVFESMKQHALA
ncbi:MAG: NmrA family NAD(P)-binding protein [Chitinispirillaceae bacterium]|nr:NmrA family NAD(P)-binding protein [Chitinispirillaceae bacterium]